MQPQQSLELAEIVTAGETHIVTTADLHALLRDGLTIREYDLLALVGAQYRLTVASLIAFVVDCEVAR